MQSKVELKSQRIKPFERENGAHFAFFIIAPHGKDDYEKPFGPKIHCAIDYGFTLTQFLAPTLFGLKGTARTWCYVFGAAAGGLTALTDQPYALKRLIPARVHGQADTPVVPILLLLPWLTSALKQRNARFYFLAFFAAALTNYLLTDYDAPTD